MREKRFKLQLTWNLLIPIAVVPAISPPPKKLTIRPPQSKNCSAVPDSVHITMGYFQGCQNHGCSGCSCTRFLLYSQFYACTTGAQRGCNGCTKALKWADFTETEYFVNYNRSFLQLHNRINLCIAFSVYRHSFLINNFCSKSNNKNVY